MRIIGGAWRKSVLRFPARPDLRPTPDRVRETLFNWLGQALHGMACLDLYAGSGALGFEAASRGAGRVVLVERDRASIAALRENAAKLDAQAIEIAAKDASVYLATATERFDVVFLDPPFRQNAHAEALGKLPRLLKPGARVYVETPQALEAPHGWRELKRGRAGHVHFHLMELVDDRSSLSGDV